MLNITTTLNLEDYINYLTMRKKSDKTKECYIRYLNQFSLFLNVSNVDFSQINERVVEKYFEKLTNSKYKNSTIKTKMSVLSSFFKFVKLDNLHKKALELSHPCKFDYNTEIATIEDVNKFHDYIDKSSHNRPMLVIRNHLLIDIFYYGGLRSSELIRLTEDDVAFDVTSKNDLEIKVKNSSGRLTRKVNICHEDEKLGNPPADRMINYLDELLLLKREKLIEDKRIILNKENKGFRRDRSLRRDVFSGQFTPRALRNAHMLNLLQIGKLGSKEIAERLGIQKFAVNNFKKKCYELRYLS